jgi:arginase
VARIVFIGAPIDSVGRGGGAELAPAALRELGILAALGAEDAGDLEVGIRGEERDPGSGLIAVDDVLTATATIRAEVGARVGAGERPFLAGGCCSVLPGALAGARDALGPVSLFYFDGHLDLYDGETSPTGEAADMPVSVALGLGPAAWVAAAGGASVAPRRTALVGFGDEAESLRYGMRQPRSIEPPPIQRSAEDLRAGGPGPTATAVAATLAERAPLWLHFDVDVLDQGVFPATDYPMPGGLDWEAAGAVLAAIHASSRLIGVSLGCYNPAKDPDHACGQALVDALRPGCRPSRPARSPRR